MKCKYAFQIIQTDSCYSKHLWVLAKCWKKCVYPQVITCRFTLVDASLDVCDLLKNASLHKTIQSDLADASLGVEDNFTYVNASLAIQHAEKKL